MLRVSGEMSIAVSLDLSPDATGDSASLVRAVVGSGCRHHAFPALFIPFIENFIELGLGFDMSLT